MHYYPRPVFLPTKSACKTARSCKHSRCMAVLVRNALKSLQNSLMSASQISQDVTAKRKNAVSPNSSWMWQGLLQSYLIQSCGQPFKLRKLSGVKSTWGIQEPHQRAQLVNSKKTWCFCTALRLSSLACMVCCQQAKTKTWFGFSKCLRRVWFVLESTCVY